MSPDQQRTRHRQRFGEHAGQLACERLDCPFETLAGASYPSSAGYEQRQTTATTGPAIAPEETTERYAVNALGVASNVTFSKRKVNFGLKFFEEFANRSTFQGFSLQVSGSVSF